MNDQDMLRASRKWEITYNVLIWKVEFYIMLVKYMHRWKVVLKWVLTERRHEAVKWILQARNMMQWWILWIQQWTSVFHKCRKSWPSKQLPKTWCHGGSVVSRILYRKIDYFTFWDIFHTLLTCGMLSFLKKWMLAYEITMLCVCVRVCVCVSCCNFWTIWLIFLTTITNIMHAIQDYPDTLLFQFIVEAQCSWLMGTSKIITNIRIHLKCKTLI
jgi:hypothetical protein